MSLPPYSPGTVMPSRPSSPSLGHRSCGKALSSSILAARGAIPASAKRRGAPHRQLELADGADALLGQAVGGLVGGDAFALGNLVDARQVVVDRAHHAHRTLA